MDVYWLEQSEADVPGDNQWLCASEAACLAAMRIPKRRADWSLGRWTAKRALAIYLNAPTDAQALANIELRPAASGSPEAFIVGRPADASVSLSHRNGLALCALAAPGMALGCDLELIEPRSDAFVADYFTNEEQALLAQASAADLPLLSTLLWSAKESALKALHEGLRLDTRSVKVSLLEAIAASRSDQQTPAKTPFLPQHGLIWHPVEVHSATAEVFRGWWQQSGNLLRTVVGAPPPNSPMALKNPT